MFQYIEGFKYERPKLKGQRSTLSSNGLVVSEETMFWCVDRDLLNLFIAIVSLGLTYQVRIMTKASTV